MNTATCRYCGQAFMIDIEDDDWEDAEGDMSLVATRRCNCEGALYFKHCEDAAEKANDNIDVAFNEDNKPVAELLKAAVPYLINGDISYLTISKPGVKGKLSKTMNNNIKVSRTNSETKVFEE